MGKILIIKAGAATPALAARRGDFEDWVLAGLQVDITSATVVDVRNGGRLSAYDQVAGVVITGSPAMVTDHHAWSERTAEWLRGAVEEGVPTLGICYGHQLLAYAMGGQVGDNPNGLEVGTIEVHLSQAAGDDRLLAGFPSPMRVHASHQQTVQGLPPGARRLAWSAMDAHQAMAIGDRAWGVQFHPEFDADIVIEYLDEERQFLREKGRDADRLIQDCADTPYGAALLRRFAEIVEALGR